MEADFLPSQWFDLYHLVADGQGSVLAANHAHVVMRADNFPFHTAVDEGRLPTSALTVEIQFTIDPTALSQSRLYGLMSALQADTDAAADGQTYQRVCP